MRGNASRIAQATVAAILLVALHAAAPPTGAAPAGGPRLLRVTPGGEGVVGRDAAVALSFDRPIDLGSLERAVSFEPPVEVAVSGESECLVVPVSLLAPDTRYAFRVEPGVVADLEGRKCPDGTSLSFITRGDGVVMDIPAWSYRGEVIEGKDPQGVASVIGYGVGHYPGAGRPGRGNFVVMAHASGRIDFPFNRLFDLGEGDEIRLSYGGRDYIYRWSEGRVVRDTEVWILDQTPEPLLTAFVCCAENGRPSPTFHPPFRYVVRAFLAASTP